MQVKKEHGLVHTNYYKWLNTWSYLLIVFPGKLIRTYHTHFVPCKIHDLGLFILVLETYTEPGS